MIRILSVAVVLLLCIPVFSLAQNSDEFSIRFFGLVDTIPPTVPVIQQVDPVSDSQINITWATSTDNFAIFGYVLFRDGGAIATTTNTFFSDTGLAASTTYSYSVTAFDGVPNYSTSSTPVATTTPEVTLPLATSQSGGTRTRVVEDSFAVEVGVATATLEIDITLHARVEVRYGLTRSYELAYIVGNDFKKSHAVNLYDLLPNTRYFYEVIGYTPNGVQTILQQSSFVTLNDTPPAAPTNVSNLTAGQRGGNVQLTYLLPTDFPTAGTVRVVRSHFGYPQFLNDGIVVYEGTAESVTDQAAFDARANVFYTVFVIDPNGLVSSGAVVRLQDNRVSPISGSPESGPSSIVSFPESVNPTDVPAESASTTDPAEPPQSPTAEVLEPGFPELQDFTIVQNQSQWSFSSSSVLLSSDEPFTVSVDSSLVTGDFKTIVATIYDPRQSGKQFSFLLRLNSDKSAYTATIAPFRIAGASDLMVEVFDYDARVIGTYRTAITFMESTFATTTPLMTWYLNAQVWLWWIVLFAPVVLLASLWFVLSKRSAEEEV